MSRSGLRMRAAAASLSARVCVGRGASAGRCASAGTAEAPGLTQRLPSCVLPFARGYSAVTHSLQPRDAATPRQTWGTEPETSSQEAPGGISGRSKNVSRSGGRGDGGAHEEQKRRCSSILTTNLQLSRLRSGCQREGN